MTDVSVVLRPPCCCPSEGHQHGVFHTKLYKFGWSTFPNNARMKNRTELNLGKVFYVWLIYLIQDFWLWLRDTANQQYDCISAEIPPLKATVIAVSFLFTCFFCVLVCWRQNIPKSGQSWISSMNRNVASLPSSRSAILESVTQITCIGRVFLLVDSYQHTFANRSFSRDVITFQNLKLKIHQSFYPHQAKEVAYLYLFTILQLNSLLRFETRAFWISGLCGCVTQGDVRVCWKIYTYLMILSPFRSWSIRK